MRAMTKLLQIVVWLALTVAGFHVRAAKEPLYDGLGSYTRKITTESAEAQRYFDQGLGFLHGFNHGAAIRSFQQAAELDPKCAMAHWGIALACGPHINSIAVPPPAAELAWKELGLAQENAGNASPVERALIDALANVTPIRSRKIARRWIALTPMPCAKCGKNIQRIQTSALFSRKQ